MEQPKLEPAPLWDAGVSARGLTNYDRLPTPYKKCNLKSEDQLQNFSRESAFMTQSVGLPMRKSAMGHWF